MNRNYHNPNPSIIPHRSPRGCSGSAFRYVRGIRMGNYRELEYEFIERSLALIEQYESIYPKFDFKEQYNYTLLINCLLGLIVMPKEKIISYIPKEQLTIETKNKIGLKNSWINSDIKNMKDLIIALRHSIAHFDIQVESKDEKFLIDEIIFKDKERGSSYEIVRFEARDLLPFIKYYSNWLLENLRKHKQNSIP